MKKLTPTSQQLYVFAALAQRRSFTLVAIDLDCDQSAVSHAMAALQANLGVRLYRYADSEVRLTSVGRKVYRCTNVILGELRAIRALARPVSKSQEPGRSAVRLMPKAIAAAAQSRRLRRAA